MEIGRGLRSLPNKNFLVPRLEEGASPARRQSGSKRIANRQQFIGAMAASMARADRFQSARD